MTLTIVLDLDHTLTDGANTSLRAHAEELLEFAFSEATHVVLWTASDSRWCAQAHERLLNDALARVSRRLLNVPCTWTKVFTSEHCATNWSGRSIKPLEYLWTSSNVDHFIPGVCPERVVLIDDDAIHLSCNAPGSVILVSRADPNALLGVTEQLRSLVGDHELPAVPTDTEPCLRCH